MPVLVRKPTGEEQTSKTENVSLGGFAAVLSMDLRPGERVTFVCPYNSNGQNIEQEAECRWGAPVTPGGAKRIYGFRYVQ